MKQQKVFILLIIGLLLGLRDACADARTELQVRLNKINSFSARFVQRVTSAEGHLVQQSEGQLWLKRPALFRWITTTPDENLLVSDGKTLWFYTPAVEQVTATWLKDALAQTPFILLTSAQSADWSRYRIAQQGDRFELTPRTATGAIQHFTVTVNRQGVIQQFATLESDGQRSQFTLQRFQRTPITQGDLFSFKPPAGVVLDDQR